MDGAPKECTIGGDRNYGFDKEFIEKFINKKNSFYKNDDFIDSCSLFWSAKRVVKNNEIQIPNKIIRDVKGIIMQMKI